MLSLKEQIKEPLAIASETDVWRIVDKLLGYAAAIEAEEIYFDPRPEKVSVDFSCGGEVKENFFLVGDLAAGVGPALKAAAGIDQNKAAPQTGGFKKEHLGKKVVFTAQTFPAAAGEKMILRLKRDNFRLLKLNRLGMGKPALQKTAKTLKKRGLILVVGGFDSGKTTTLYGLLETINRQNLNIATIEESVAFDLPYANQSQLSAADGFDWRAAVSSIGRQDPDAVMIGEIRDRQTAESSLLLAEKGHLVLAGLHSSNIVTSLSFFQDLGVPLHLFNSAVKMVITQRLLPRNCPHCLVRDNISQPTAAALLASFDFARLLPKWRKEKVVSRSVRDFSNLVFYKSAGCARCGGTGLSGRIGAFEILEVDGAVKKAVREGHFSQALAEVEKQGGYYWEEDALMKALNGLIDVGEVLKAAGR